jgi:hypothetical protein
MLDSFSGLVVSTLASGTQVRGLKPRRKNPQHAFLWREVKNLSHVPALRHVKEPSNLCELRIAS